MICNNNSNENNCYNKLLNKESLIKYVDIYKKNNQKIIFVNGCFDVLHAGHIDLFNFAKSKGDILIVGLNSDISIKNLKGVNRPIIPQNERTFILQAILYIDHIIIFDESTAHHLIELVRPDVVVKGIDYSRKPLPEIDVINKHNCKLYYFDSAFNTSTTDIIERVKTLLNCE